MLLTAVSVAVAIVPEGLPAVVTITLALAHNACWNASAHICKLPAVETSARSPSSVPINRNPDRNRMTVVIIWMWNTASI